MPNNKELLSTREHMDLASKKWCELAVLVQTEGAKALLNLVEKNLRDFGVSVSAELLDLGRDALL